MTASVNAPRDRSKVLPAPQDKEGGAAVLRISRCGVQNFVRSMVSACDGPSAVEA